MRLIGALLLLALMATVKSADDFLPTWMSQLRPIIGSRTILDLSLPGTHDTLTYDLSTVVSEGGDDDSTFISEILHLASEIGLAPGAWIRDQAKTQGLSVSQQLENGIRFLDFRNMYTSGDWYSLHFVQSNNKAVTYHTEIRAWLDLHPEEVIVIWISKHGSECKVGNDQYPNVTPAQKQAYWNQIVQIYGSLLINHEQHPLNSTSIDQLVAAGQRVAIFASDYAEFTANSTLARNGCDVDNQLPGSVDEETTAIGQQINFFQTSAEIIAKDKAANKFFLMSMASSGPGEALKDAFLAKYWPFDQQQNLMACAAVFSIPNMTNWCPPNLQDISQLGNYYNQIALELSLTEDFGYPNAIYLDAVAEGGVIRTGTQLFLKEGNGGLQVRVYETQGYAYVDTLALMNVRRACKQVPSVDPTLCLSWVDKLNSRRALNPYTRWSDIAHGRWENWPQ